MVTYIVQRQRRVLGEHAAEQQADRSAGARKMAAVPRQHGYDVSYYENVEVDGAAVDNVGGRHHLGLTLKVVWREFGSPARPEAVEAAPVSEQTQTLRRLGCDQIASAVRVGDNHCGTNADTMIYGPPGPSIRTPGCAALEHP